MQLKDQVLCWRFDTRIYRLKTCLAHMQAKPSLRISSKINPEVAGVLSYIFFRSSSYGYPGLAYPLICFLINHYSRNRCVCSAILQGGVNAN